MLITKKPAKFSPGDMMLDSKNWRGRRDFIFSAEGLIFPIEPPVSGLVEKFTPFSNSSGLLRPAFPTLKLPNCFWARLAWFESDWLLAEYFIDSLRLPAWVEPRTMI